MRNNIMRLKLSKINISYKSKLICVIIQFKILKQKLEILFFQELFLKN